MSLKEKVIVFAGLSLKEDDVKQYLPDAIFKFPAKQGDMVLAFKAHQPSHILLIDGFFEFTPAVWHKEILHLISNGVTVYGASSMGALRASELHAFGMIGHGVIFDQYKNGEIEDDDEVAVSHGPKEIDYPSLSDAMVNIRSTVKHLQSLNLLSANLAEKILNSAKSLFYKERTYANLLKKMAISPNEIKNLMEFFKTYQIDQKKLDAISLLESFSSTFVQSSPGFKFNETVFWHRSLQ